MMYQSFTVNLNINTMLYCKSEYLLFWINTCVMIALFGINMFLSF